jgi:hypothetical protein
MDVNTATHPWGGLIETFAAQLTEAAYPVALHHRTVGSWIDLELKLWKVLSDTLQTQLLPAISPLVEAAIVTAQMQCDSSPADVARRVGSEFSNPS